MRQQRVTKTRTTKRPTATDRRSDPVTDRREVREDIRRVWFSND